MPGRLAAAIPLSVHSLSEADPVALTILRLCAFLAPEPIPVGLIVDLVQSPSGPEMLEPVRAVIGKAMARHEHIKRIGSYGLARIEPGQITVHRLVQAILRSQFALEASAEMSTYLEAALGAMNPGDPRDAADWPAWSRLLPHLLAIGPERNRP